MCWRFHAGVAIALGLIPCADLNAQAHRIDAATPGLIESGAPPFAILNQEALGLDSPPTDLRLMPDGRVVVMAAQQLALGDGVRWETFRQSQQDSATTAGVGMAVDVDGSIYVGTATGFGRIEFIQNNEWRIHPVATWPKEERQDRAIPRAAIVVQDDWVWHSGSGSLISWKPGRIARLAGRAQNVEHVFTLRGETYLSDRTDGRLSRIKNSLMEPVFAEELFSPDATITSTLPFNDDCLLIGTHGEGLQLFDGKSVRPFSVGNTLGGAVRINDICQTEGGFIAAAVQNHGIVFFDREGRTIQSLTRELDHRLSGVKRLLPAAGGVIWCLLDRGVLRVEFPSRTSYFEPFIGTGVNTAHPSRLDGRLWFLADGKIQRAVYASDGQLSELITDMPRNLYAFTFSTVMGVPVAGTSRGAFFREETGWVPFATDTYNLRILEAKPRNGRWMYGARGEIGWLRRTEEGFEVERAIQESSIPIVYNAVTDHDGSIWLEHGTGQFGRITFNGGLPEYTSFNESHGIPESWAQAFEINGVVRFNVAQQIFRFDEPSNRFVRDLELEQQASVSEVYGRPGVDSAGRLWVATLNGIHVLEKQAGRYRRLPIPLSQKFRPYYFTFESGGIVWMHSERRLERYDPAMPSAPRAPLNALITQVHVAGVHRSFFPSDGKIPELEYSENSLIVHFSAPGNSFSAPVRFEVNLEGTDSDWTSTGNSGTAVFNRLKEGRYVLHVRPRSDETVGKAATLAFTIMPPWYRTNLAYAGYGVSAVGLLLGAAWLSSLLERRENARLEKLVTVRTHELNTSRDRLADQVDEIRMLSQAIEQSPVAVFLAQSDGTIVFANPRACESSGYSCEELIASNIAMLRNETADSEALATKVTDMIETGTPWRGQLVNRHKDGRVVHVRTMIAPIRTPDGVVRHQLILEEDITEWLAEQDRRRKLEAHLFQAQKLESIGILAGGIAHDFNNILTGILGYCELARLAARGDAAVVGELNEVVTAGLRAKDLVSQILTFSRKSTPRLVPMDLVDPVTEALKLVRASTPSSVQIVVRMESGRVLADKTQIQQVVLNLCTNAIHAMQDRAGILTVTVQSMMVDATLAAEVPKLFPGAWMRLSVCDNGRGMDAATLERIFDPFFTTKRQGEGTGLGLSIVQGIVATHKSAIRVRSTSATGTTFEIYFTLTEDTTVPKIEERAVPRGSMQEILVVDDERAVANFAATRLKQLGCVFEIAVRI